MKQIYILTTILFFSLIKLNGQTFINGSFENTTSSGCDYNNSNSEFNSIMPNVIAFGNAEEIDILRLNCLGLASIPDGDIAIMLHGFHIDENRFDAISLELSSPLISGNTYTIDFKARSIGNIGSLLIGVSTTNNNLNSTTIYTANLSVSLVWSNFSFDFVAPNNGTYITVMPTGELDLVTQIDDFTISPSTLSINDFEIRNSIKIHPNPTQEFINVSGLIETEKYSILNKLGQVVKKGIISENEKINIQNLTNGFYFLKFQNGNVIKFIKE